MITPQLQERVLAKLGLDSPPSTDWEGLRTLYKAWCLGVPFDNLRKLISLRSVSQGELPGATAEDFFSNWLMYGTGGTCWPSSNALFSLFEACGFEVTRTTGSMFDLDWDNHGTVIATIDGKDWLVDSSMLTMEPLPLTPGEVFVTSDPVYHFEIDPEEDGFFFWSISPPMPGLIPCRLLERGASEQLYRANYERSREKSIFNTRLYVRKDFDGCIRILVGNQLYELTSTGITSKSLSPTGLISSLIEVFGFNMEIAGKWASSGSLEASMQPFAPGEIPEVTRVPPSLRN